MSKEKKKKKKKKKTGLKQVIKTDQGAFFFSRFKTPLTFFDLLKHRDDFQPATAVLIF